MKKFYFLVFSLLVLSVAQSQVTIFSENMGTPVSTTVVSAYTGWQNGSPITFSSGSPEVDVRTSSASSGYTGASGGGNVFITSATGRFLEIAGINTVGYTNIALSLGHFKSTTAGNNELTIEVSEDGISYSALTYSRATGSGTANWILLNPSGTIPATANLRIRFTQTSTTTQFRIDDVVLTGNSGACSGVPSGQAGFGVITPSFNEAEINVSAGTGGTGRVVKVNTTNSFANMVDGDDPAANIVYSSGEQVVYNGTGTGPFTVTGLSASTTYYVAVYEYNCGTGRFYLNPGATTSFATTAVPSLGLQLTTINTAVLIDFDNTLAGVNEGQFAGSGFTPTPSAGQLNSNAWATTGMSDGASAFGATSVSGDHARGTSPGGVTTGGFYAFETSAGNRGLGVQATGSDWAPGTITLKVQNNTGVLLNSVDVGYLIWVLNDQGRSNSFNFSYSTDDITYTAVGALDYTSTDAADGSPAWASVSRSTNLPLVIPIGGYFYLRWSGADVGGSGSRDEFAIDDIEITGNATQIPTPVKFSNVKAYAEGNAIRIDWSNLTETDVNHYTVERSASSQFADLGSVDANRNDGGKASYTYLDVAPLSGVSFYRIRSEEFNGKVLYSVIVKVDTRGGATDVVLYPNPISGNVISMQATALNKGMYTIQVFNTSGQRVLTQSLDHPGGFVTQTIQLPALQSGMYSLQLSGGATRISKSFIVR